MKYTMTIAPAISSEERHEIEITLKKLNFTVSGGTIWMDKSKCDITFEDRHHRKFVDAIENILRKLL